jgi:D-alanyl-D-alanine carboxypeptidase
MNHMKAFTYAIVLLAMAHLVFAQSPSAEAILTHIQKHPSNVAFLLVRNDTILVSHQANKPMPLASTVKIVIAIEYAHQVAIGELQADEQVPLSELEKFFIKGTDGGAHQAWLGSISSDTLSETTSLEQIAKGMIKYSSNANTEYLLARLGLNRVNARIESLGFQHHSNLYYIVSALFVGKELFPGVTGSKLEKKLRKLPLEKYVAATNLIHKKLIEDPTYKNEIGDLSIDIQKIWSDRLPAGSPSDYVSMMKKLNDKSYFKAKVYEYLDPVMEQVMENPANQAWLRHSGTKGGSTAFVLTKALYATDKEGNTTEMALFFNEVGFLDMMQLLGGLNMFELQLLSDRLFRKRTEEALLNLQ